MIKRLVKLEINPKYHHEFEDFFNKNRIQIMSQEGCNHVELFFPTDTNSNTFFTYSLWDSDSDLNRYRKSDFFSKIWPLTKAMLIAKPLAWSLK